MRFYLGKRRSGKTTALLHWMVDAPQGTKRVGVFHNRNFADMQKKLARERNDGLEDWQFMSYDQLWSGNGLRGRAGTIEIGIDELQFFRFGTFSIGFVGATIEHGDITVIT